MFAARTTIRMLESLIRLAQGTNQTQFNHYIVVQIQVKLLYAAMPLPFHRMSGPSSNPIIFQCTSFVPTIHGISWLNSLLKYYAYFLIMFSGMLWWSAHARLMFRTEVTLADAIAAVVCVESSMTTSALLDGMGNALHSSFADNPDEECILEKHQILVLVI